MKTESMARCLWISLYLQLRFLCWKKEWCGLIGSTPTLKYDFYAIEFRKSMKGLGDDSIVKCLLGKKEELSLYALHSSTMVGAEVYSWNSNLGEVEAGEWLGLTTQIAGPYWWGLSSLGVAVSLKNVKNTGRHLILFVSLKWYAM